MSSFPLGIPMRFENEPLLWTVKEVYTKRECDRIIKIIQQSKPQSATNNLIYRNQDRVIRDDPQFTTDLFLRLKPHLPATLDREFILWLLRMK